MIVKNTFYFHCDGAFVANGTQHSTDIGKINLAILIQCVMGLSIYTLADVDILHKEL